MNPEGARLTYSHSQLPYPEVRPQYPLPNAPPEEERVPTVRTGPAIGLIAQAALLGALTVAAGLGEAGWLAGVAYGVGVCFTLTWGLHRTDATVLGPADRVTLTRAVLVGGVTALVVQSFLHPVPIALLVGIATVALVLDWVDGQVARRTRTESALGARFDMEVDAFLILVLSAYVARFLGPWVLTIGLMRYAYVAASWVLRWMRGGLPYRYWRKVVAAAQGIVLTIAAAGVLPVVVSTVAVAGALVLLIESFGRDVLWLHHTSSPRHVDHELRVGVKASLRP
jgi:phosphatidylglycerophosphate synthase